MSKYDDLAKLEDLRERGAISEEEFQQEKAKILAAETPNCAAPSGATSKDNSMLGMDESTYLMVMHLSQFAGFVMPVAGLVAPILLWQVNKEKSPEIDRHGRNITNFMISMTIYTAVAFALCFALVGFPILIGLITVWFVFVIMASVKANQGKFWTYPLSIPFFKVSSEL